MRLQAEGGGGVTQKSERISPELSRIKKKALLKYLSQAEAYISGESLNHKPKNQQEFEERYLIPLDRLMKAIHNEDIANNKAQRDFLDDPRMPAILKEFLQFRKDPGMFLPLDVSEVYIAMRDCREKMKKFSKAHDKEVTA